MLDDVTCFVARFKHMHGLPLSQCGHNMSLKLLILYKISNLPKLSLVVPPHQNSQACCEKTKVCPFLQLGVWVKLVFLPCTGSSLLIRVTLLFAVWVMPGGASLHACVGLVVESLAFGRASRCAADIFGFFHEPRPVRTTPFALVLSYSVMPCPPPSLNGTRRHLPTCDGAERPVCERQPRPRGGGPWCASIASPMI